jgi:hypothetical protein
MMRRTKEGWARLTAEERSDLVRLEHGQGYCGGGCGFPEDIGEC